MTEQQYRDGWDAAIDRAQEELVRQDQFSERTLRILDGQRMERLVPPTNEPPEADATPDEAFELGEVQGYDKGYADGLAASPHPPTREQIAEAIEGAFSSTNTDLFHEGAGSMTAILHVASRYERAVKEAVLAPIQNGADRG